MNAPNGLKVLGLKSQLQVLLRKPCHPHVYYKAPTRIPKAPSIGWQKHDASDLPFNPMQQAMFPQPKHWVGNAGQTS